MRTAVAIILLLLTLPARAVVPFPMAMWGHGEDVDVTPISIPGLVAWWRSDSLTGYTNGQSVTDPWEDLTGNGWDGLATNALYNPVYRTNVFGVYPGLEFDYASATRLDITSGAGYAGSLTLSNGWTIMALWSPTMYNSGGGFEWGGGSVIGDDYNASGCCVWGIYQVFPPPSSAELHVVQDNGTPGPAGSIGWDLMAWDAPILATWERGDDGKGSFHIGMTNVTGLTPADLGTMHLNTIGGNNYSAPNRLDAKLGELCVWDAALTTNQIQWLYTNYFTVRYGL